jgi:hypothetical protein
MNMLAVWYAEGDSSAFRKHCDRVNDYLWLGTDGMKMQVGHLFTCLRPLSLSL